MSGKIYTTGPISDSNRRIFDTDYASSKRAYQTWKGSNKFFLGGRLMFGPDVRSLLLTIFLIVSPVILFCVFSSEWLFIEFKYGNLLIAAPAVFSAYIVVLLLLTSGRDPGVIPRNLHPPDPEYEGDSSSLSADWVGTHGGSSRLPPTRDVFVNGTVVKVKYCHTCMLYRPPRCSHCSICNNCVERFDHHCPWVGQCIGKRNYRFFFMFVSSTTLLCVYVLTFCCLNMRFMMKELKWNLWKGLSKSPVSGFLIIYTFVAAWFVGGLTTFHLYLICTNQTTHENFRFRYSRKTNPYNRGLVCNVWEIFFSKIPSSKINFRAKVKGYVSSSYPSSLSINHRMTPAKPKMNLNIEIAEKRQTVAAEDFKDIQRQIQGVGSLERCGTQPIHTNLNHRGNWDITPDIHALAAELGTEHGLRERKD